MTIQYVWKFVSTVCRRANDGYSIADDGLATGVCYCETA